MDGITKDSIKTAKLMKQLWPQLTDKEAIDEVKKYTNGKNTAIFTEVEGDTIVRSSTMFTQIWIMLKVVNIVLLDS